MRAITDPDDDLFDDADRAAASAERERSIALRTHWANVQILEDQDIDQDGFVHCLDCPTVIPPERLAIVPHAVRCAGCQGAYELRIRQATGRK